VAVVQLLCLLLVTLAVPVRMVLGTMAV